MGTRYDGRHRSSATPPAGRQRRTGTTTLLRRPVLSSGLALALIGATAAGYAQAGDLGATSWVSATISRAQAGQAPAGQAPAGQAPAGQAPAGQAQVSQGRAVQQVAYRPSASLQSNLARSAATDAAQAAAAAAEAARLVAERQAAEARAARDAQRQALLANAQRDPRSVARTMLAGYGWGGGQFGCLDSLWTKESGWSYTATNGSSGAYGIPQSLPASKMATVAGDYRTNPVTQMTWGLQYIKASYGTPCAAWAHSQATGWY